MSKNTNILTSISDLLPEGLDESTLGQIAQLVARKIEEEVKSQIGDLTVKVTSFIRGNIERLKEQAVKELELENETFLYFGPGIFTNEFKLRTLIGLPLKNTAYIASASKTCSLR